MKSLRLVVLVSLAALRENTGYVLPTHHSRSSNRFGLTTKRYQSSVASFHSPSSKLEEKATDVEWVDSEVVHHGYAIFARPREGTDSHAECVETMDKFRTRFPPVLMPKWMPHVTVVGGFTDVEATTKVAEQLAKETKRFEVDLGGAEVDGDDLEDRKSVYFTKQELRGCWVYASACDGEIMNEQGDDRLGLMCRRGRELAGGSTQTTKYVPHLSLVYFHKSELDQDQRLMLKNELNDHFKGVHKAQFDTLYVAYVDGPPGTWYIIEEFPLQS